MNKAETTHPEIDHHKDNKDAKFKYFANNKKSQWKPYKTTRRVKDKGKEFKKIWPVTVINLQQTPIEGTQESNSMAHTQDSGPKTYY